MPIKRHATSTRRSINRGVTHVRLPEVLGQAYSHTDVQRSERATMSFEFRNERARVAGKYPGEFERGPCKAEDFCDSLTIRALRTFCEVNNRELEWVQEYGEPGYVTPENGILIANWNRIPQALQDRLEAQGYELEWSDEWYVDNGKSPTRAWRTQPDGMSWEPRVRARDGYMITPDSDPQELIDSALNDDDSALPSWFDPSELESRGFVLVGTFSRHFADHAYRALRDETRAGHDSLLYWNRDIELCDIELWTHASEENSPGDGSYKP